MSGDNINPIHIQNISNMPIEEKGEKLSKNQAPSVKDIQSTRSTPMLGVQKEETKEIGKLVDTGLQTLSKELDSREEVLKNYTNYTEASSQYSSSKKKAAFKTFDTGIQITNTTKSRFGKFRKAFYFVLGSNINLLKKFPDLKKGIFKFTSVASPFVGLGMNTITLIATPYQLFKSKKVVSGIDAHIKGIDEKSFIAKSNKQFLVELTNQLQNKDLTFENIKKTISLNEKGLSLDDVMRNHDPNIDTNNRHLFLKLVTKNKKFKVNLLKQRDFQHAKNELKTLKKMLIDPNTTMNEIHQFLFLNGVSLNKATSKEKLIKELSHRSFKDALFLAIHSKQKMVQGLQAMQSDRYKTHLTRTSEQKNKIRSELFAILDQTKAAVNIDESKVNQVFADADKKLKKLGLNLAHLPPPDSHEFTEIIEIQNEIDKIDSQLLKTTSQEEREKLIDQRIDHENHREAISREFARGSSIDNLRTLLKTDFSKEPLLGIAAHNKSRRIETLSSSSKNGLAAMSKEKAVRERKYFNLPWFTQKLLSPLSITIAALSIVTTVLVLTGTLAATPFVLTATGTALFWLGIGFSVVGIIHQIRNKPRQLWQNAAHLRGTRRLIRQVPLEITKLQKQKRTIEASYAHLLQSAISARLDQNLSKKDLELIVDTLPSKVQKILSKPRLSENDQLYLEKIRLKNRSKAVKLEKELKILNQKLDQRQKKVQKHLDKLSEASRKDALHGGVSLRGLIGLKPKDKSWKELGIIFPKEPSALDLNKEIKEGKENPTTIIKALIEIDQNGGLSQSVKDEMSKKMGLDFDGLKERIDQEGKSLEEELPKSISQFFSSGLGNIYQIAKETTKATKSTSN
ncbi:MAG: hypothetical protein VX777_02450 [Chlamydiota bacterium]|nr:hypothetical protein [Chlamydiota bacterium]